MCVMFAEIQPAPKGNLLVHCGGEIYFVIALGCYGFGKNR